MINLHWSLYLVHFIDNSPVTITAVCTIGSVSGGGPGVRSAKTLTLAPDSATDIVLDAVVENPSIWWPRQWGEQPLYVANLTVLTVVECAGVLQYRDLLSPRRSGGEEAHHTSSVQPVILASGLISPLIRAQ
jgi:hypothetical protein